MDSNEAPKPAERHISEDFKALIEKYHRVLPIAFMSEHEKLLDTAYPKPQTE